MVTPAVTIQDAPSEALPFRYSITSYGMDFDVEGLVRRIDRQDVYVPAFQRGFVWTLKQASRFIESLLLGLPVPGIFLSRDGTSRLLVIDGQQRLRSLHYYYQGTFPRSKKRFALNGLTTRFNGLTYASLDPEDRRRLNDSIIHATVIRQDHPDDGSSSIYFVFERLNTGSRQLQPQEIRAALYHGPFDELLDQLNRNENWRSLFGPENKYRRDQELILRFLALYYRAAEYRKPLKDFLNTFMGGNRHLKLYQADEITPIFEQTVGAINAHIGSKAFKPLRALNAAVLDSVMVGVAWAIRDHTLDTAKMTSQYERLIAHADYRVATDRATTDEEMVKQRLVLSHRAFSM